MHAELLEIVLIPQILAPLEIGGPRLKPNGFFSLMVNPRRALSPDRAPASYFKVQKTCEKTRWISFKV